MPSGGGTESGGQETNGSRDQPYRVSSCEIGEGGGYRSGGFREPAESQADGYESRGDDRQSESGYLRDVPILT